MIAFKSFFFNKAIFFKMIYLFFLCEYLEINFNGVIQNKRNALKIINNDTLSLFKTKRV